MISEIYVLKDGSERIYSRRIEGGAPVEDIKVPGNVNACSTLFRSRTSTILEHPYTLEQNGTVYIFVFFDSFSVVLTTKKEDDLDNARKKAISLGSAIAKGFGELIRVWTGDIGEIDEIDVLVRRYLRFDLTGPDPSTIDVISELVDTVLENHRVAYVGVFDSQGTMVCGNVPQSHMDKITREIVKGTIKPSTDIVPTVVKVRGYQVQLLKVRSMTIAVSGYKESGRLDAVKAIGEIAHSLNDALSH
ncbi:MAG: hypothetical protein BAJATHORv1_30491 [Candidatus Thorarchaeota archaeon]|nr:MAG: hypothetical protein BAJATHORv1_30491 [Candidatus Thorarchaeota archaeon]